VISRPFDEATLSSLDVCGCLAARLARAEVAAIKVPRLLNHRTMKFLPSVGFVARTLALSIAVLLLLQGLFVATLVVVGAHTKLPAVRTHILEAFNAGALADDQMPRIGILFGGHQFTECVSVNLALDAQADPLKSAMLPRLHFHMVDPCRELHRAAAGSDTTDMMDYARYWHGYRLLLWPALENFGIIGLRVVSAIAVALAVGVFYLGLRAAIGFAPALILLGVFALQTDLVRIWQVATHALSMTIILAGTGLFAFVLKRANLQSGLVVLAAVLGSVFNFFDFLINPPMMPMLLSFLVIAVMIDHGRGETAISENGAGPYDHRLPPSAMAAMVAAGWFFGYAGTWATEWGLAIWLSDHRADTVALITHQIAFRLYGLEEGSSMSHVPLVSTIKVILRSFESLGTVPILGIIAAIVLRLRERGSSFDRSRFYLLILPLMIPFLWFEALSNHTQLHSNFTSRSAAAAFAMTLAATVMAVRPAVSIKMLWSGLLHAVSRPIDTSETGAVRASITPETAKAVRSLRLP
jgi:hypothetical protein